jgi:lipopolysaccharide/colanic/teichoic acid biosynthesis glycosyltransferase
MKRFIDITFSISILFIISPFLLLISLAILLTMGSPVLFKQKRVGRNNKEFTLYKFRSMAIRIDAENGLFEAAGSSRITPLGRILRKTKIDELPQLLNVLKGEMSIVGPRPEVRRWVDEYPERWRLVLRVTPGITDPASIEFRNEEYLLSKADNPDEYYKTIILPRKLDLYLQYIEKRSIMGDIGIIIKTLMRVLQL